MPPALPLLLETPQPTRQFTMREKSLAVLLCLLTLLLSGRHLSPGSGAHLQSHGRDEPGSGKVDRGTDGHTPPALPSRPSRGRPPRAPQRRSPPACGGACPAPAQVALHRAPPCCGPLRRGCRSALGAPPAPGARRGRGGGATRPCALPLRPRGSLTFSCWPGVHHYHSRRPGCAHVLATPICRVLQHRHALPP